MKNKLDSAQDKLEKLKNHKEQNAKDTSNNIIEKLKEFTNNQCKRVNQVMSSLDEPIKSINDEKQQIRKAKNDCNFSLSNKNSFDTAEMFDLTKDKMKGLISNQNHIKLLK